MFIKRWPEYQKTIFSVSKDGRNIKKTFSVFQKMARISKKHFQCFKRWPEYQKTIFSVSKDGRNNKISFSVQ
jgi:hypothetical protein